MNLFQSACLPIATTLMVACGGGGGGSAPTAVPATAAAAATKAEGVYAGSLKSAALPSGAFNAIVLEDDSLWAIYGTADPQGRLTVFGFINGSGTSANGAYTVAGAKDFYYTGAVASGTVNATYSPGVSIAGTTTGLTGSASTFSGTTAAIAGYTYASSASLSDIAGTWSGSILSGAAATLTITSGGTYTGASAGCTISGTVTPRASGKNVFDVSYVNGAAPCASPGLTAKGIGVVSSLANGQKQLIVAGTNESKSTGTVFFAQR